MRFDDLTRAFPDIKGFSPRNLKSPEEVRVPYDGLNSNLDIEVKARQLFNDEICQTHRPVRRLGIKPDEVSIDEAKLLHAGELFADREHFGNDAPRSSPPPRVSPGTPEERSDCAKGAIGCTPARLPSTSTSN